MNVAALRRPQTYQQRIAEYERRKAAWTMANPVASHEEYQASMRRIAAECGV